MKQIYQTIHEINPRLTNASSWAELIFEGKSTRKKEHLNFPIIFQQVKISISMKGITLAVNRAEKKTKKTKLCRFQKIPLCIHACFTNFAEYPCQRGTCSLVPQFNLATPQSLRQESTDFGR